LVIGIGEILWDMLPSGRRLGGAPANFAYCSHLLGARSAVVSRVGKDQLGDEIREQLLRSGVSADLLQEDAVHSTGIVNVTLDTGGQPRFQIEYPAAWDFIQWNRELERMAQSLDAVCFGSLAQRSEQSRSTIMKFLDSTRKDALRVFDVNLRQSFYSRKILRDSVKQANVLKLNHQELPRVAEMLDVSQTDFVSSLFKRYELRLICVTRGEAGSSLFQARRQGQSDITIVREAHPGLKVQVKDAVGAGDAFTAGLVHELLRGSSLDVMNDTANRMGAWVASSEGAMPALPKQGLAAVLTGFREK
jgi:fructokinase